MRFVFRFSLAVSIVVASVSAPAQTTRYTATDADPFEIGRNRSFSASTVSAAGPTDRRGDPKQVGQIVSDLAEALSLIRSRHVWADKLDVGSLTRSAINGALGTLDPHSSFFDRSEYVEFLEEQNSEYSGIGAVIANFRLNGRLEIFVQAVVPGSPAALAKLGFGDRILKIDDEDLTGRSSDEARDAIRGDTGTRVRLMVQRASTGQVVSLLLRRRAVPQPSVKDHYVLGNGLGYINMSVGFNYTTADELTAAMADLKRKNVKGLILDLRDNPGGILEQAVKVAEKFLPAGSLIVTQRGRLKIDNRVWRSTNKTPETLPLVLLVNENSASASEIVAGALQDNDRALIVGMRTFGKGLVQSLFDVPYGSGLTLTTGRYYTPSGRSIQRDYSDGNLYDYYNHRGDVSITHGPAAFTAANRPVFGGDGIEPDERVAARSLTQVQEELLDPIYFFVRELVNGRVRMGSKPNSQSNQAISRETIEPLINVELVREFEYYVVKTSSQISVETLRAERQFIVERLRYDLTLAIGGETEADRVLLNYDPVLISAIANLPKASNMAIAANRRTK